MSRVVIFSYKGVPGLYWAVVDGMRINGMTAASVEHNIRAMFEEAAGAHFEVVEL